MAPHAGQKTPQFLESRPRVDEERKKTPRKRRERNKKLQFTLHHKAHTHTATAAELWGAAVQPFPARPRASPAHLTGQPAPSSHTAVSSVARTPPHCAGAPSLALPDVPREFPSSPTLSFLYCSPPPSPASLGAGRGAGLPAAGARERKVTAR